MEDFLSDIEVVNKIDKISNDGHQLVSMLFKRQVGEAFKYLSTFCDEFIKTLDYLHTNGYVSGNDIVQINKKLGVLLENFQDKDYVSVVDIFVYDMEDELCKLKETLNSREL